MKRCICEGFPRLEPRDPYHGGHGLHTYGQHDRAMVWLILDGQCGVAGYFLYYSYVCRVKAMSFESVCKNQLTLIPVVCLARITSSKFVWIYTQVAWVLSVLLMNLREGTSAQPKARKWDKVGWWVNIFSILSIVSHYIDWIRAAYYIFFCSFSQGVWVH